MVEHQSLVCHKMAIFLPENQALGNNSYVLPDELKKHLAASFAANAQYSQSPGFKKVTHMVNPQYNDRSKGKKTQGKKGIPYGSMKKLKMTFDYIDPKSLEYTLLGGEMMKHWVNDTLNRERTKVEPELKRKKNEKLKNGTKPKSPKQKPLKSGDTKLNLHESTEDNPYISYLENYSVYEILEMFECGQKPWTNLINPEMYHKALLEFTKYGQLMHFPTNKVYQWFGVIMRNTAILRTITDIAGHSRYSPTDEIIEYYFHDENGDIDYDKWDEYKEECGEDDDYEATIEFLDEKEFFEWFQLPDGTDPWSDFGIKPLEEIISEYSESMTPEQVLVLINKALDVVHQSGDLASIFIVGGSKSCSAISEEIQHNAKKVIKLTEQQIIKLKNLLK